MDIGRTEIVNAALLYANQDTILDSEGETRNSKLCARFYDSTLQEILSGHPWTFAMMAAELNLLAEKPRDFRFQFAYQLPTNFGRIHHASSTELIDARHDNVIAQELRREFGDLSNSIPIPEYVVQGQKLCSNLRNIRIVYTRTDVKPFEMTPQFRNFFAASLASKIFVKVTGGVDGFSELQKQITQLRAEARQTDSANTDTLEPNRPNLLVAARVY